MINIPDDQLTADQQKVPMNPKFLNFKAKKIPAYAKTGSHYEKIKKRDGI